MSGENLSIKVIAKLDQEASFTFINKQIQELETKINKLKLNVQIDDKVLGTLNNLSKQMNKIAENSRNTGKYIEEVMNPDGSKVKRTFFDGIKGEFSEVTIAAKKSGKDQLKSIEEVGEGYDKLTRQVERYNSQQKKIGETVTFSDNKGINSRTISADNNGNVIGHSDTYNATREEKLNQDLINGQVKLRESYKKLAEQGNLTYSQLKKGILSLRSVNNLEDLEKAKQKYAELADIAKLASDMSKGRENAEIARREREIKAIESQAKAINKVIEAENTPTKKSHSDMILDQEIKLARKQLIDLARTGQYTTEELRKIGQGINLHPTIQQVEQMKNRMANMKFGTSFEESQNKLKSSLSQLNAEGKITESSLNRLNNAINSAKNINELNKLDNVLKRVETRSKNVDNFEMFQRQMAVNLQNLTRTHGNYINTNDLDNLKSKLESVKQSLKSLTPQQLANEMKNINMQFKELSTNAKESAGATEHSGMSLMEMFKTAMVKFCRLCW